MITNRPEYRFLRIAFGGLFVFIGFTLCFTYSTRSQSVKTYVGSEACRDCHEKQHKSFTAYSKKSVSFNSITKMRKGLTDAELKKCFECHTTGYGKPGGFRSEAETPHLKNSGCEVCHGPGSAHVKTGNPKEIKRRITVKDCEECHSTERVAAFNYKPLIYGGAH